ncbi:hypothetical protein OS493_028003 [Desmophyllum pertusum]|uniref:Uncharacterized protein n=1 Tax=Desmophyllum pertusum TaxID=174260 RepID=A0A9X0D8X5_9CNID|nr:hypothetical protein OS493_028003 [Desmophyllum pertusum]
MVMQKYVFPERQRMAFIHHLESGDDTDYKNKDIAMVKLGHQWEYGRDRADYTDWEKEEQKMLEAIDAHYSPFAKIVVPEPEIDETVYAVHFGGGDHKPATIAVATIAVATIAAIVCCDHMETTLKIVAIVATAIVAIVAIVAIMWKLDYSKKSEKSKILRITPPSPNYVSMLHLEKKKGVLPAGSSGCPIMVNKEDKYYLVGLHFSGDTDDVDGEAQALQWSQGIREYIETGVRIIADIGSYVTYSKLASQLEGSTENAKKNQEKAKKTAQESLEHLESMAKCAKLTIYLCNGEVINQRLPGRSPGFFSRLHEYLRTRCILL